MSKRFWIFSFTLLTVLLCAAVGYSQTAASASIVGRISDPQNAVVPNANVSAKNVDTGIERETKTTNEGFYRLPNLAPGTYDVTVTAPRFAKAVANGLHLNVGDTRDVNFTLQVGAVTSTIEVTSQMPLIETTKTEFATVVNETDLARLPVTASAGGVFGSGMNDFASLALTAPGVRQDLTGNNFDLVGPGAFNDRDNLFNIDGGNITDQVVSGRDAIGASVDEIREFQVLTNNYNAEYGQAGGIVINAITKSGTNTIHGDFHFFARGKNLSASDKFYNLGLRQDPSSCPPQNVDSSGNLITPAGCPRAPFFKHETGFTLGGPFIKNKTFWFLSYEKLMQGSPLTLLPPGQAAITVQQPDDEVMWTAKVDHNLTNNHHVSIRFNAQRLTQDNQLVQIPVTATPDALTSAVNHDHTLNISLTSTLTPHLVNEARFLWHRFVTYTPTKSTEPGLEGPDFYFHAAFCCPQGAPAPWGQNRWQGIDNLTWVHGTHTIKTGVNFSYYPYASDFAQVGLGLWDHGLSFSSSGPPTGLSGANPPTSFTIATGGPGFTGIPGRVFAKDNIYGLYVQDTWKIKSNFTLNYGVRYDYEAGAFKGGTIPNPNGGCFQANGLIPACSSDKNNFQPRIGIAYSPHFESGPMRWLFGAPDKTLLTASFGEVTQLAYLNISLDSLNFDGVTLLTGVVDSSDSSGCWPSVAAFWPGRPPQSVLQTCSAFNFSSFGRVRPISPNLHNPEMRHVSASYQRQLSKDMVFTLQYIGTFGFGQFGERDTNFPAVIADPGHPGYFYFGDRPNPLFSPIRTQENSRTSQYNGMIVNLRKQMSHHFQVNGSYTWSHTISSTEDFYGASEPGDPFNVRAERADAQLDVRHAVNLGAVIDTEKMSHIRGLRWLFNDWQFGIATQLQSGRPYPISTGDIPFANSLFFGIGNETFQRPNVLADGTLSSAGIAGAFGTNYLISSAGVAACTAAGQPAGNCPATNTFLAPAGASGNGPLDIISGDVVDFQQYAGNLKRNAGRTDPFYRTDLSITRSFRIPWRESTRLELRADFFNLLNRANYQGFNANNDLDFLSMPSLRVCVTAGCDPTVDPTMVNPNYVNCTTCIAPLTGRYIGSGGQVLKLTDLQHGRVSQDLLNPIWGAALAGIGDPSFSELPRQIQLSIRVRF